MGPWRCVVFLSRLLQCTCTRIFTAEKVGALDMGCYRSSHTTFRMVVAMISSRIYARFNFPYDTSWCDHEPTILGPHKEADWLVRGFDAKMFVARA